MSFAPVIGIINAVVLSLPLWAALYLAICALFSLE